MALNFKEVVPVDKNINKKCYKCGEKASHEVKKESGNIFSCVKPKCLLEAIKK